MKNPTPESIDLFHQDLSKLLDKHIGSPYRFALHIKSKYRNLTFCNVDNFNERLELFSEGFEVAKIPRQAFCVSDIL